MQYNMKKQSMNLEEVMNLILYQTTEPRTHTKFYST